MSLFRSINTRNQRKPMYEGWYDCIKSKYQINAKLCYMDTGSFIRHVILKMNIYKDIADNIKKVFDTSNYVTERPKGKNQIVIRLMKGESGGKNMTVFEGPVPKTCFYWIDNFFKKREKLGLDYFNHREAFIEYSNDMEDVKNIEEYNLKKRVNSLSRHDSWYD